MRIHSGRGLTALIVLSGFCAAVNFYLIKAVPHYQASGPNLVINGSFKENLRDWTATKSASMANASVYLSPGESIKQVFDIPASGLVFVSAIVILEDVTLGNRETAAARVHINGMTADGAWHWGESKLVFVEPGTSDRSAREAFIDMPGHYVSAMVEAEHAGSGGRFVIEEILVRAADRIGWVHVMLYGFAAFWLALGLLSYREARRLGIGWQSVLLLLPLLIPNLDRLLADMVAYLFAPSGIGSPLLSAVISALVHVAVFAGLTLLMLRSRVRMRETLTLLVLLAVVSEEIQFLIPGRDFQLLDMACDVAGIMMAFGFWVFRQKLEPLVDLR